MGQEERRKGRKREIYTGKSESKVQSKNGKQGWTATERSYDSCLRKVKVNGII